MSLFPLTLDRAGAFPVARAFLASASYDDATLCRELGMRDMSDLNDVKWERLISSGASRTLRLCITVFLRGQPVPERDLRETWGAEACEAFVTLGLLRPTRHRPDDWVCPVWVYPADGCIIASDRRDDPDGDPFVSHDDVVFPAIYGGTLRFLQLMPEARGGDVLDLCGGTGIGAFRLARSARSAATSDLTERSALFAEFNARLNGVAVESLCGDLYAPVAGRTFDLITAHPPFVPASGQVMVYRDGGDTGEQVTRGVVAGLAQHLRPGGRCMILCVGRDAADGTFEQRVRGWLGEGRDEFDVVFGLEKTLGVDDVVEAMRRRREGVSVAQARQIYDRLVDLGTRRFVYGVVFIERFERALAVKPLRVSMTPAAEATDFDRVLAARRRRRQEGFSSRLSVSMPRLADDLELAAKHVARDGSLLPAEYVFSIEGRVGASLRVDGWIVPLIARMDGQSTVADIFHLAKSREEMPGDFSLEPFLDLVASLVEKGFLEVNLAG